MKEFSERAEGNGSQSNCFPIPAVTGVLQGLLLAAVTVVLIDAVMVVLIAAVTVVLIDALQWSRQGLLPAGQVYASTTLQTHRRKDRVTGGLSVSSWD